jgi:hypothetical protein
MNKNAPHSAPSPRLPGPAGPTPGDGEPAAGRSPVFTTAQLRAQGISGAQAGARCRDGGPWQALLPGVYLLRRGAATGEERLRAALLYAARPAIPAQPCDGEPQPYGDAVVTGPAALALHGFSSVPPVAALERVDVLVPRTRRLRSLGCAAIVRAQLLPEAEWVAGLPVAPVARAVADTAARLTDGETVRRVLTESVRDGHCAPADVVGELNRSGLLELPPVAEAVDALLAEGRSRAEDRLYALVREFGLPDPVWNVELRLPGGPGLGRVDAYWPDEGVAVRLNTRSPGVDEDTAWAEHAHRRERLERLGITVVPIMPRRLRESPEQQAMVVRTALMASAHREPASYVMALPG